MRAVLERGAKVLVVVLACAACGKKSAEQAPSAARATASVASAPPLPAPPLPAEPPELEQCRVITVRGSAETRADAGAASPAPAVGTVLVGRDWLELDKGVEVVLRHAATTRELSLRGPGRFLACFQG